MTLFAKKYRIESTRLPHWHYDNEGCYYVTICTQDRVCHFGQVLGNDMRLSAIGEIVAEEWVKTGQLRANVTLDEWIIMPNHLHLIFHLTKRVPQTQQYQPAPDLQTAQASKKWRPNSVGSIIGQFKGQCTKRIRAAGHLNFAWQPRYYERVITTEASLAKAQQYVADNPTNWNKDQNNPIGIYM